MKITNDNKISGKIINSKKYYVWGNKNQQLYSIIYFVTTVFNYDISYHKVYEEELLYTAEITKSRFSINLFRSMISTI